MCSEQRESSATIKAAPTPYEQTEPAKAQKIIEFDCRGLEFTEFLPEVCCRTPVSETLQIVLTDVRESGWWTGLSRIPSSKA
jgi:hypothetical protein